MIGWWLVGIALAGGPVTYKSGSCVVEATTMEEAAKKLEACKAERDAKAAAATAPPAAASPAVEARVVHREPVLVPLKAPAQADYVRRCEVVVVASSKGVPSQVDAAACPASMRTATADAVKKWRFAPASGSWAGPVRFTVEVDYGVEPVAEEPPAKPLAVPIGP